MFLLHSRPYTTRYMIQGFDGHSYTRRTSPKMDGDRESFADSGTDTGNNQFVGPETTIALNPLGRLPGSVWTIPSEPLLIPDETRQALNLPDHFAAFPQEWPRRIITGWSPTGICTVCGEGRRVVVDVTLKELHRQSRSASGRQDGREGAEVERGSHGAGDNKLVAEQSATIIGYFCACPTPDAPTTPAVILDPFGGTGTVAGVARMLGRYGISNDLSESYNRLAAWRIWQSRHFTKTEQRSWADRQTSML